MTIANRLLTCVNSNNGKFLGFSSVWDIHNSTLGAKRSNVIKQVDSYFELNKNIQQICAVVGAKGRSQHSKTDVLLFDISNMSENDLYESGIKYTCTYFTRE